MAGCCSGTGGCRCTVTAEVDDGCNPVAVTVTGAGSTAAPFVIGTTWDVERAVRLDGNEPWQVGIEGSCEVLIPRQFQLATSQVMCNGAGLHVGYALVILDVDAGSEILRFQALDTTTLQTSLPGGWTFCCPQSVGDFHPMCTAAVDDSDPDTLVGWAVIRLDIETGVYQQQYINIAGTITTTLPTNWIPCGCGATDGSGDPVEADVTENYITITVPMSLPSTANTTLTDMATAEDFYATSTRFATLYDLTDWEEARIVLRRLSTASAAAAEVAIEYSTTNPNATFTGANWLPLGTSDVEVSLNTTNTTVASSWIAITALARDDVYLAPLMRGGDGAADPVLGRIDLQLRRQVVTAVEVSGGGGGGGGGGSGAVIGSYSLRLGVDGVVEDALYPDHGIPGLSDSDKVDVMRLPTGYVLGTWLNATVTVFNVTGVTTADLVLVLRNMTDAADVATVTIASGTSPTSNRLVADAAASGTFVDEDVLQWQINGAQADNAFGLHADVFYELT